MQLSLLLGEYCVMLTISYFSQLFMKKKQNILHINIYIQFVKPLPVISRR